MADGGGNPTESEKERLDRELMELVQELRVALTGVQILFAFLLTVPFTQRFTSLTATQEKVYYATLLCTTASTVLLIAPSAHHRINFRQQDKGRLVFLSNTLAIVGLGFLALAMTGVVLLVTDFLFATPVTVVCTTLAALMFALFWYALPLRRRVRSDD